MEIKREKREQKAWCERMTGAVEIGRQAKRKDIEIGRRKYCLANRIKGLWGPV